MKRLGLLCFVFALIASANGQPSISGTHPAAIPASTERQWITVVGNGFVPDSVVTLAWGDREFVIPAERTTYVNSTAIQVFAGIFPQDSTWTARVTNPDNATSNSHMLLFENAPALPATPISTPHSRVERMFRPLMAQPAPCEDAILNVIGWSRKMATLLLNEGATQTWCGVIDDNLVAVNMSLISSGSGSDGARLRTSWRQPDPGVHGLTFEDDSGSWAVMYVEARTRSVIMMFFYGPQ